MKAQFFAFAVLIIHTFAAFPQALGPADSNLPRALLVQEQSAAYREAVLGLMLAEADTYARHLCLSERLPLRAESMSEVFITPPRLASKFGAIGSLRTTNYSYGFGRGRHLSYITRLPKDKSNRSLYDRMKPWSIDPAAVDTNAAYMTATQILGKAFVDLTKLSTVKISVSPITILDMTTSVYTAGWRRGDEPIAQVTFDQKKGELWSLRVEDPTCILRNPLLLTNLESSILQTISH